MLFPIYLIFRPLKLYTKMEQTRIDIPTRKLNKEESAKYTSMIIDGLEEKGFVHIKEALSESDYQKISENLGSIMSRSELKLNPEKDKAQEKRRVYSNDDDRRPSIYKHLALDFHNDNPIGNRLSWYCIKQDERYGALWLIDSKAIVEQFTEEEKDILATINVRYISIVEGKEYHPWMTLLAREDGKDKAYFASWHLLDKYDTQQLQLIDKFKRLLEIEKNDNLQSVRLQLGESVFVDNRRMLHARGAISEDSKRHIIRLAINSHSS
jgi:hypothetical protein